MEPRKDATMKKIFLLLLACLSFICAHALIVETGSLRNFLYGREPNAQYDNWISHLAEGVASPNYNTYAPYDVQTNGFGNFRVPNASDIIYWGNMLDLFVAGDYDGAQGVLDANASPYQVVQFNDTDTGRTYYMIREIPDMSYYDDNGTPDENDDELGAFTYGWGLFIYNPSATRPVIITVPHPCDDFPTPAYGLEAMNLWNAAYLMINGAGREVRWSNIPPYTNSKSISDPTRSAAHPFNQVYRKFADAVREHYSWREFSAQMHSYDWNRHQGYPNVQISAGNPRACPNLPIRDLSLQKNDLINAGRHLMIPENTVGIHDDVFLNDFYGVNYSLYEFTFDDGEHNYPVNDHIDLPAYTQNQQMIYTQTGTTDYDVYEPFFHAEMDELPNCYEETENNYKWFYGWDEGAGVWDMDNLFTNFMAYYRRVLEDMEPVLVDMFAMNDNLPPTDPGNLHVVNQSLNSITLGWDRSSAFDFDSYQILFATEPIGESNYQIFDRTNSAVLASQACQSVAVTGLNNASQYYFKLRAKDKNGNLSQLTNQVSAILAPANITSFSAFGMDDEVRLHWGVNGQTNNNGFSVYRKMEEGDYVMVDSWQTNPALSNPTAYNFEWWDNDVDNGVTYTYKVSCTNLANLEFYYNYPVSAAPMPIHTLTLSNMQGTLTDTVNFGANPFASDAQDVYWDVTKSNPGTGYVWAAFWERYWGNNGTQLQREIKGGYDQDSELKSWVLRVRSDQTGTLSITASSDFDRAEKLYLQDGGTYHNLLAEPYQFINTNANVRTMNLFWGNLQPKATIGWLPNSIYQGGSTINFNWSYQYPFLVDHVQLSIINDTDSLLVNSFIPAGQYNYSFSLPSNLNEMQDCRLALDVVAVDGIRTRFWSDYRFALVPQMYLAMLDGGWKMSSNPWLNTDLSISEVFGAGSLGYMDSQASEWVQSDDFDFGTAYWVWSPDISFYSSTNPVQSTEISFPLVPGWNFVPNPHLCAYDIEDISFTLNGSLFRFSEMLSQKLVSRAVYVFDDGVYAPATRVKPFQSLLIKYYGGTEANPQIRFCPYYSAPDITPQAPLWSLKTTISETDGAVTLLLGASSMATDDLDFKLDLPAGPQPPFGLARVYFPISHPSDLETSLQSDFRTDFSGEEQQKVWDFNLSVSDTDPLDFSFEPFNIPDGWQVMLSLEGTNYYLGCGESFVWQPPAPGVYQGYIRVSNYELAADDPLQPPLANLRSWPNPFNPDVNIAFDLPLPAAVKVEVFNIRGQKVKTLLDQKLGGGSHQLVWNGKNDAQQSVASGVYFTRIQTARKTRILKMVLMK